jgi:3D-(3,5/4)-trihydroxycyclohexane-1,2-dione acylhydrolase (decyclizing)
MGKTVRLTMAQAVTHFLKKQMTVIDGKKVPIFGGVWAIFGHGNVAGIGEALYQVRGELPTYRAHNEQGMAHAAIAYAKASFRQRFMACTTRSAPARSIWSRPLAWPMSTASRSSSCPATSSPTARRIRCCSRSRISATARCRPTTAFRPVSRYFDRITRPEQIISA